MECKPNALSERVSNGVRLGEGTAHSSAILCWYMITFPQATRVQGFRAPPIVMDTNVLVAGACRREKSRAYRVLMGVLRKEIPLMLTNPIALEYLDVLQRPGVLALTRLSHSESADLVTDLVALSREIQTRFSWRPNLADESDNKFVEAAIHASAIVVTYNLGDFRSPDLPEHGWTVMSPGELTIRYLEET